MSSIAAAPRNFAAKVTEYGSVNGVVTQNTRSRFPARVRVAKKVRVENANIANARLMSALFGGVQLAISTTVGWWERPFADEEFLVPEMTTTSAIDIKPAAIAFMYDAVVLGSGV